MTFVLRNIINALYAEFFVNKNLHPYFLESLGLYAPPKKKKVNEILSINITGPDLPAPFIRIFMAYKLDFHGLISVPSPIPVFTSNRSDLPLVPCQWRMKIIYVDIWQNAGSQDMMNCPMHFLVGLLPGKIHTWQ